MLTPFVVPAAAVDVLSARLEGCGACGILE